MQWFVSTPELDQQIRRRFSPVLEALTGQSDFPPVNPDTLATCAIKSSHDVLASIIVIDQFSRNIHRSSARAFDHDAIGFALSQYLVDSDALSAMEHAEKQFSIMPYMHQESIEAQQHCVELFQAFDSGPGLKSAIEHRDIIQQFGRFPHRNAVLGRESTPEEIAYLKDSNTFGQ